MSLQIIPASISPSPSCSARHRVEFPAGKHVPEAGDHLGTGRHILQLSSLARPRRPGQPPLTAVLIDSHRDVRQGYQEDSLALRHLPRKGSINPAGLLHSDLQGSAHSSGLSSSVMKCSSRSRDQGCMLATWSAADKYDWKATRGFAGMLFDARPSPAAMYSSTPCKLLCDCL